MRAGLWRRRLPPPGSATNSDVDGPSAAAPEPVRDAFGHALKRADQLLGALENGLNLIAGGLIFALMLFGVAQIVARTLLNAPILGYIDVVEVAMVGFAVLSIAFVQRVGGHVRMELLVGRLTGRPLWLLEAAGTAAAGFIVAVLIPHSYRHFARAFEYGDSTIDVELVTWPAKLVVPVALAVLLARLALQLAGYLRLAWQPDFPPVAVPESKDPAAQASETIALASGTGRPSA